MAELCGIWFWNTEFRILEKNETSSPQFKSILNKLDAIIENNILFCIKNKPKAYEPQFAKRLVVPETLVPTVLTLCHDDIAGAHLGLNKNIQENFQQIFLAKHEEWRDELDKVV